MRERIKRYLPDRQRYALRRLAVGAITMAHRATLTKIRLANRTGAGARKLEIGPGIKRLPGYETFNVVWSPKVDYVGDASGRLPFPDGSFQTIYASHVLEHIPWYRTVDALREWVRVLAPGGHLEIWVPDGLKIAKAFVEAEEENRRDFEQDGWWRFNDGHDPCLWMAGRMFSYGDGSGRPGHQNWHLALFSPRWLEHSMREAGLTAIEPLERAEVRGHDHGWINLGRRGQKPSANEKSPA